MNPTTIRTEITSITDTKCRTCIKTASSYQSLHQVVNDIDVQGKTYGELLTNLLQVDHAPNLESLLPQKICKKCASLLKNIWKFILEARKRHEQLLQCLCDITTQSCLEEIPIDLPQPQSKKIQVKTESDITEAFLHNSLEVEEIQIKTESKLNEILSENRIEEADASFKYGSTYNEDGKRGKRILSDYHLKRECIDVNDAQSSTEDDIEENFGFSQTFLPVRCDVCDNIYDNSIALKKHKSYVHMPEDRKIPCALCDYKAPRPSVLKIHLRNVHGSEMVDKYLKSSRGSLCCELCSKSYTSKNYLQKHLKQAHLKSEDMLKKTGQKPKKKSNMIYLCPFCGQSFAENGTLSKHIRTHTDDRPFKCNFCEKAFRNSSNLKYHLTTHSDEKPHTCAKCGKSFKRKDKLHSHMHVHSELRPYKCIECGKTFKYAGVLKTHMQIHACQTLFTCRTCGENFSLRTSLSIHCAKDGHLQ